MGKPSRIKWDNAWFFRCDKVCNVKEIEFLMLFKHLVIWNNLDIVTKKQKWPSIIYHENTP